MMTKAVRLMKINEAMALAIIGVVFILGVELGILVMNNDEIATLVFALIYAYCGFAVGAIMFFPFQDEKR